MTSTAGVVTTYARIEPHHELTLKAAGIPIDAAHEWGIRSVSRPEHLDGTDLDYLKRPTDARPKLPEGLLYPLRRANGTITYQLRLDEPEVDESGKPNRKYLQAPGTGAIINIPAMVADRAGKAKKIAIVEGTKQTIAACLSAPNDMLVVGIQGCANFSHDGLPLEELREVLPVDKDVEVYICFDADWKRNADVWAAAERLKGHYEVGVGVSRGKVKVADLGAAGVGGKNGLDDYLGTFPVSERPGAFLRLLQAGKTSLGTRPRTATRKHRTAGALGGAVAVPMPNGALPATQMGAEDLTIPHALADWSGLTVQTQDGVVAVIGGANHGLWTSDTQWDGASGQNARVLVRVTDWIAWRTRFDFMVRIDASGRAVPVAGARPRWTVEIVRADDRRWRVADLTESESTDPVRLVDLAGAAVAVPVRADHRFFLGNALRVLGADGAGQVDGRRFTSLGWLRDDELGPVFVAPSGSMTAVGPTQAVTAGPPPGSDDDALTDAQLTTGWDHVAEGEELRAGVLAFQALLNMAPGKPEAGVALIGGMLAATLHLHRRASVLIRALPKVGKSHLLGAAAWFWNSMGPDSFPLDMPGSSEAVAKAVASWYRDAPLFADDFKLVGDESDLNAKRAFSALARGSYSGASAGKGTVTGGQRRGLPISSVTLFTGEEGHPDQATMQRVPAVDLVEGDVDLRPGGAVDQFATAFGRTGLARATWANLMRWTARQMRDVEARGENSLAWLTTTGECHRGEFMSSLGTDRAGETVSVLAAGWSHLRAWATDAGLLELLPDRETVVDPALRRLAEGNRAVHAEADPSAAMLAVLKRMLSAREAYVELADGKMPVNPATYGWRADENSVGGFRRSTTFIGRLSKSGDLIVVSPAAVTAAIKAGGLGIAPAKLAAAMSAAGFPGGVDVRHNTLGISGRPRGWAVPIARLGLDSEDANVETPDAKRDGDGDVF